MKFVFNVIIFLLIGMVGGIFATQIIWPYFVEKPLEENYQSVLVSQRDEIIAQENVALTQGIEKAEKTILAIGSVSGGKNILYGSGLIVTNDGLVLSLSSVVPKIVSIFYNSEVVSAEVLKKDSANNLSLLKVAKNNLPACRFSSMDKIKLGEKVFLMGKKYDGENFTTFVDDGIIKSFSENLIETNISEDKSAVGTILFNIDGEVLGINYLSSLGKVVTIPVQVIREFTNF